jgi:glycosyltransferase involved in cell wall biosynthesis
LLDKLASQDTGGCFTHSIVVVDNDQFQSAKQAVVEFASVSMVPLTYYVEPRQGIARARNLAIRHTNGEFVALIDDDEIPANDWLLTLFRVCNSNPVSGVLGPVKAQFDQRAPKWVRKGQFYDRPVHPTGMTVEWRKARSGNVLLRKQILDDCHEPFRPEFRSGEDQDFFRRMMELGHRFIWCADAVVYEVVPPARWNRQLMLKRALLRGTSTALHPSSGVTGIAKSILAVAVYTLALPLALLVGQHRFMWVLVRVCDHLGKLLGLLGVNVIRETYVTD